MKFYCLLSDSTIDRPNLSSHEINDRDPPMTMGADTKVLPFSSRDRIPVSGIFWENFHLSEIISNFPVRQSFGIMISNLFNT